MVALSDISISGKDLAANLRKARRNDSTDISDRHVSAGEQANVYLGFRTSVSDIKHTSEIYAGNYKGTRILQPQCCKWQHEVVKHECLE